MSRIIEEDSRLTSALRATTQQYIQVKKERTQTAKRLYESFLKDLIFVRQRDKAEIAYDLRTHFKKKTIKVVAVDGTKYMRGRRGCIVFYVMATPLVYEVDLAAKPPRWYRLGEETTRHNVMVLMPIPLSEIYLVGQEGFARGYEEGETDETEREETMPISEILPHPRKIGQIDMALMRLAEIYSIYWSIEKVHPDVIMVDGSLFEMFSYTNRQPDQISLHKGAVLGIKTLEDDFRILKSIPVSQELEIPSMTSTREFVTARILQCGEITLKKDGGKFSAEAPNNQRLEVTSRQIESWKKLDYLSITSQDDSVRIKFDDKYANSLKRLQELFIKVCQEGFGKNNLEAFKIYMTHGQSKLYLYMNESDIETICRIGFDLIIKKCWEDNTLLFSVTKDSYVRFFIDNFLMLGSPRHLGIFKLDPELLPRVPSTDTGVLFDISHGNDNLNPPLDTIEFDPAVSTVFSKYDESTKKFVIDRFIMIAQERQFLRSLVQISKTASGRKSYVYTVDRITYPEFDVGFDVMEVELNGRKYRFAYYRKPSKLSTVINGLMTLLSSNKHDAVFGYPDPLFEVDQYVKTVGKTHLESLDLSLEEIDLDEFSVTYRQSREAIGEHHV
jgi:hypothetical protein